MYIVSAGRDVKRIFSRLVYAGVGERRRLTGQYDGDMTKGRNVQFVNIAMNCGDFPVSADADLIGRKRAKRNTLEIYPLGVGVGCCDGADDPLFVVIDNKRLAVCTAGDPNSGRTLEGDSVTLTTVRRMFRRLVDGAERSAMDTWTHRTASR